MTGIEVANNIRAERNRSNLTIDQVVEAIEISKPTYIKYEKDASGVTNEISLKLAELFNCNIKDFLCKDN